MLKWLFSLLNSLVYGVLNVNKSQQPMVRGTFPKTGVKMMGRVCRNDTIPLKTSTFEHGVNEVMIKPPPTLPAHLQEQWIQATEEAYMEGVVATLARLHKQLGCNLSVDIDAF